MITSTERVSVIIPTVGRSSVYDAVTSALHQTYPVAEVIVVVDAACAPDVPDDDRIVVLHTPTPASGPSIARDIGVAHSTGSVIALLDDDDIWLPEKLSRQLELRPHTEHWIVACRCTTRVNGRDLLQPRRLITSDLRVDDYLFTFRDGVRFGGSGVQASTMIFSRSVVDKVPLSVSAGSVHDEARWLMQVKTDIPDVRIESATEALVRYGRPPESVSRSSKNRTDEYIDWGLTHLAESSARVRGDYLFTSPMTAAIHAGAGKSSLAAVRAGIRHGRPGPYAVAYAATGVPRAALVNMRNVWQRSRKQVKSQPNTITPATLPAPVETETASPPKVSVITICFKDLAGLHKTVDSLRAQEYAGEIEHIIVDGGSGQETTDYLQSLEPQPDHWVSEPDGGRYDAMNKGIEKATGDLIWLMHAGDAFADPDAVDSMVTLLSAEGQPRANWGYGRVRAIGRRGPVPTVWGAVPFDTHQFMIGSQPIPHQATVIGADLAKALGPYDLEFGLAADQLYLFRATLVKPPLTVARVVCDFDSGGAGSIRPMRDSFDDLRRGWDLFGVYPFGSRRKARLHSRYRQILATVVFALSKHGADSE